jgi:phenylalanyl-tRNA synthetase alpha chain
MQVMDELVALFAELGFSVAEGPDIEDDWHNFTALNFPPGHPARDTHDTFFLNPDPETGERKLLRTHTSPVQVRTMQTQPPPIRIIAPGRVYRKDWDQTHVPVFHQIEGLVIDRGIHMGHLKWTLETFLARFFETDAVTTRFRPHHFPFTEPSAEMDVQYERVGGELRIGQGSSWLEILGCGMVHPRVLRNCGIDPDEYQGFAWGVGVDRLAMLKYGIPDVRDMFTADPRWLAHYGFSAFTAPNPASGLS